MGRYTLGWSLILGSRIKSEKEAVPLQFAADLRNGQ
jgi:hypothetical protein